METVGYFETSDSTINQIYNNAYWGIRGNYRECLPTARNATRGWAGWATGPPGRMVKASSSTTTTSTPSG